MSTENQTDPLGSTPPEQETCKPLEPSARVRMIAAAGRRYLVADTTPVRAADLDADFIVFDVGYDRSTREGRRYPPSGQRIIIRVSTIDLVLAEKEEAVLTPDGSMPTETAAGKPKIMRKRRSIDALNRLVDAVNDPGWRLPETCGSCPVVALLRQDRQPLQP